MLRGSGASENPGEGGFIGRSGAEWWWCSGVGEVKDWRVGEIGAALENWGGGGGGKGVQGAEGSERFLALQGWTPAPAPMLHFLLLFSRCNRAWFSSAFGCSVQAYTGRFLTLLGCRMGEGTSLGCEKPICDFFPLLGMLSPYPIPPSPFPKVLDSDCSCMQERLVKTVPGNRLLERRQGRRRRRNEPGFGFCVRAQPAGSGLEPATRVLCTANPAAYSSSGCAEMLRPKCSAV